MIHVDNPEVRTPVNDSGVRTSGGMVRRTPKPVDPMLIADVPAFEAFIARLREQSRVAVDTEAASYHRYVDRIYLVQLSSDTETAIVDPLAVTNLKPLGRLLADPAVEIVFHDADYDLRVLDRDYGFRARNVFDTRVAAQLLGEGSVGLGALLGKYFDVAVDKKFQRADWSRRPLTPEMIAYAATDTAHLLRLRDELDRQLTARERRDWATEEFKRLEKLRWTTGLGNGQGFLRMKGAKTLPPKTLAVLRAVYEWREQQAAALDRAPFRVLGNDALTALARTAPTTPARLRGTTGVPPSAVRRYGSDLLAAVGTGLATSPEDYPRIERSRRPKVSKVAQQRLERLKTLRKRVGAELNLEIGVLCPNGTLQAVAVAGPTTVKELRQIPDLKRWQAAALGSAALLAAVRGSDDAGGAGD